MPLASTAALIPVTIGELAVLIAYVAPQTTLPSWAHSIQALSVAIGCVLGVVAWGIAILAFASLDRADRQNYPVYADLAHRYTDLNAEIEAFCPAGATRSEAQVEACDGARAMQ